MDARWTYRARRGACATVAIAATACTPAAAADGAYRAQLVHLKPARPTLVQAAYMHWGTRLEQACPPGTLSFRRTPPAWAGELDDPGGSWGDCHPYVQRTGRRWPERCATAVHEAGHEVLTHEGYEGDQHQAPDGHGVMLDRMIIGQVAHVRRGHRRIRQETWVGIPRVCQPARYRSR